MRVRVRRVDGIEPGLDHFIEQDEGCCFIRGPTEDVTAEDQRRHLDPGVTQHAFHCGLSPGAVPTLTYLAVSGRERAGRIVASERGRAAS